MAQNPYMPVMPGMGQAQMPAQQPTMPNVPQPYVQGNGQQQRIDGFVFVNGIEGARAYQMPPNSKMPLFDESSGDDDVMFIKTTDAAGFPDIKVARILPVETQQPETETYATTDDLESLRRELEELRESVNEQRRTRGRSATKAAASD